VKTGSAAETFFVPRVRGLKESVFWIFAGLSVILLAALWSYNPQDPAFTVSGASDVVTNRMGPAGALFADVAFLLLGRSAYLLPLLVLLAGIFLFRAEAPAPRRSTVVWKSVGVLLAIATSSGLATLHFAAGALRQSAGGIVGQVVGAGIEQALGLLGATVLMVVLWLGAVSLATGVSWLAVMDYTGRGALGAVNRVQGMIGALRIWAEGRRAKQQRQEVVAKTRAKAKPAPPRIEPTLERLEPSDRVERERQVTLFEPPASGELPPLSLLDDPPPREGG
jgi:S-DNA-T family DNA segregation ATPase FtsK/SpoIIIE